MSLIPHDNYLFPSSRRDRDLERMAMSMMDPMMQSMAPFGGSRGFGGMMMPMDRAMRDLGRATRRLKHEVGDLQSNVTCDKEKFQARVDCHNFLPEEVTVRHRERDVIIEGRHEERPDEHGHITRSFTRRYRLPEDCNVDHVRCDLSSDGILTINVPRQEALPAGEKLLAIKQTGVPHPA